MHVETYAVAALEQHQKAAQVDHMPEQLLSGYLQPQ